MAAFYFDLAVPDKLVFTGEVQQVDVPGIEGDFGVLAGHAPLVAMLKPGILVIHDGGQQQRVVVTGGFAEVNPLGLTILADTATPVDDFNTAALAEVIATTEEQAAAAAGRARDKLQERAEQLKALRSILGAAGTAH